MGKKGIYKQTVLEINVQAWPTCCQFLYQDSKQSSYIKFVKKKAVDNQQVITKIPGFKVYLQS